MKWLFEKLGCKRKRINILPANSLSVTSDIISASNDHSSILELDKTNNVITDTDLSSSDNIVSESSKHKIYYNDKTQNHIVCVAFKDKLWDFLSTYRAKRILIRGGAAVHKFYVTVDGIAWTVKVSFDDLVVLLGKYITEGHQFNWKKRFRREGTVDYDDYEYDFRKKSITNLFKKKKLKVEIYGDVHVEYNTLMADWNKKHKVVL